MLKNFLKYFFIFLLINFVFTNILFASDQAGGGSTVGTGPVSLDNPITGDQSVTSMPELIGRIINGVLGFVGSLALIMFIWGGFTWMTAAGSSDKIQKGKGIIIWAIIGLVVIFSAYAILAFVFKGINPSATV